MIFNACPSKGHQRRNNKGWVADDFGVKYVGREQFDHLIKCIKEKYELTEDWLGDLYCGIKLYWDYIACTVDISMPGYIKKLLQK